MRRLYILLPDAERCQYVLDRLIGQGFRIGDAKVIAEIGIDTGNLPHAGVLESSDIASGAGFGLVFGALAGAVGGWLVINAPPPGIVLATGWQPFIFLSLFGAMLGGFMSAIRSRGIPNHRFRAFQAALDEGQVLLLIDIDRHDRDQIVHFIGRCDPETHIIVSRVPEF